MKAEAQVLKGHLDTLLLATLAGGPLHGWAVKEALRAAGGTRFDLPTGTIYPALRRLESAGLVEGAWSVVGGRRRRSYALTAACAPAHRRPGRLARLRLGRHLDPGRRAVPGDLITGYLAGLGGRLPASVAEEIAGGLADAREHYLASGLSGQDADRAAIAEFGDPARLAAELTRHAPGRRAPGSCWPPARRPAPAGPPR